MENSMSNTTIDSPVRILGGQREEKLVNAFFVLYKTARIIDTKNAAFQNQLDTFYGQLSTAMQQSPDLTIKTISDRYFVNEKLVRFDDKGLSGAASVISEWKLLGIGGVIFGAGISREQTSRFFQIITAARPGTQNLDSLSMSLKAHELGDVQLLSAKEVDADVPVLSEEIRRRFRQMARTTFFQAMSVVQDVAVCTRHDSNINTAKTKRVVHSLIDHIARDESSLLELTAIRDFDDYTYAHSANVCVYALTLGTRLELDRARLSQLGFTALFHDIGKVKLSADLIRKPEAFDEDDWIQMQRHPLLGTKTILRNLKLDVHTARAARGAFEHHINNDLTGYPALHYNRRTPGLFSRIISIVDSFDALTSGRVYLKVSISPDIVFKKMRYQMKVKFDPFLLKLFNDIIGIYPAGSLVILNTDEIALVLTNNDTNMASPYVKIVGNRDGLLDCPVWADLSQEEHTHRKIVRQIDPSRYSLDIKDFILND